jgi:uncharacterized cupin superfamily protein
MSKHVSDIVLFESSLPEVSTYPTPEEKRIKGAPIQKTQNFYSSNDNQFFVGLWEAGIGSWKINYTEHEYMHILEGKSIIRDVAGNELFLTAGMQLAMPAGFQGEWEVVEHTKKVYVIYEPTQHEQS